MHASAGSTVLIYPDSMHLYVNAEREREAGNGRQTDSRPARLTDKQTDTETDRERISSEKSATVWRRRLQ